MRAESVEVTADRLIVVLRDGRSIGLPLRTYPLLFAATPSQRADWRLIGDGVGITWPGIDEDLSVAGLLRDAGLSFDANASALHRALTRDDAGRRGTTVYVAPSDRGWEVRRSGSPRATRSFASKNEAVIEARKLARRERGALVLQNAAGKVLEYRAYHHVEAAPTRKQSAAKGLAEGRPPRYATRKRKAR